MISNIFRCCLIDFSFESLSNIVGGTHIDRLRSLSDFSTAISVWLISAAVSEKELGKDAGISEFF